MQITAEKYELSLKKPFRIAREVFENKKNVLLKLNYKNFAGLGEASPSSFFDENQEQVYYFLKQLPENAFNDPRRIKDCIDLLDSMEHGMNCAKCAVDMALYDISGKILNEPVHKALKLDYTRTPLSSMTIGLGTEEEMLNDARELIGWSFVKVKVDSKLDIKLLAEIQKITGAKMYIDANASWEVDEAIDKLNKLKEITEIEFIEQPLAVGKNQDLKKLKQHSPFPVFLDEDIVTPYDIDRTLGLADGINVKIQKCGGIFRSIELITYARMKNIKVMLGCRIESIIGITAAVQIAPLADYLDLDSHFLLKNDRYAGALIHKGKLIVSEYPGLGIIEKSLLH